MGMYAKSRIGENKDFARINDPYQEPAIQKLLWIFLAVPPEKSHVILQYLIEQRCVRKADSKVETEVNLQ